MRHLFLALAMLICGLDRVQSAPAEDDPTASALWITGEVFAEDGVLLFRADRPVQNNPLGAVILLGTTRDTAKVLLPLYGIAAEKHVPLRLFGVLQPFSGTIANYPKPLPSVQFITWKLHAPTDPDELPAGEKITLGPEDRVEGWKVELPPKK